MTLRTKDEQKAFLDGYESCAESIEKYLKKEGKQKLECLLMAVRNAVEIEDIEPKIGHWIKRPRYEGDEQPDLVCPNCGEKISWWDTGNFCANCGTELEGGAG